MKGSQTDKETLRGSNSSDLGRVAEGQVRLALGEMGKAVLEF